MSFHILSLSGGGYKGLFTATLLEELEEDIGRPLAQKFDLLAGTSIGGIIVLALALEIPTCKIKQFFLEKGKQIFSPRINFGINLKRLISLILSCQEQSSGQIIELLLGDRYYSVDTSVAPNQEKLIKLDKTSSVTEKVLMQWAHSEGQKFSGSNFYSTIKTHNALPFEPIPLEQGAL
jgi:hypothetical protein